MMILGIETSCDETAAAVVQLNDPLKGAVLLSNTVYSSMDLHVSYGGVVPEIAARSHIEVVGPVIEEALRTAFPNQDDDEIWGKIDAIAVTNGAGLSGSLLIGVMAARTLAIVKHKPLYAINHVEGHIYANFLTDTPLSRYQLPKKVPNFPMLGLIVSGGHSQLVLWRNHFDYTLLGQTVDDAIGEAFDKVAKILGLPYPGGPSIATQSLSGDPQKYRLPKAKMASKYDFSFSGVKTAVLRLAQDMIGEDHTFPSVKLSERLSGAQKSDIAASFQRVAIETVVEKTFEAYKEHRPNSIVIGGGVAVSKELRSQLAHRLPIGIDYIDPRLCTDNGAMIATLGCYSALLNQTASNPFDLSIEPNLSM
jgi:N6-L-threonylcarbamoyladenine synthase